MTHPIKLINMQNVEIEKISWLWFPYIALGKITIFQGDGGDGKTTASLAIAATATRGLCLPETDTPVGPFNVIFQTAEDGLADTIKPRLVQVGADCNRVFVIDESEKALTLCDTRIEVALAQTKAKLFIIDPLQAYLGATVDMHRANQVRPVLKRIGFLAEKYGCAFVIIGHLNKGGGKSQYRGLGSIDIFSAARSVLAFGRMKDQSYMRAFAHLKSNLAPEGTSMAYELHPEMGFRWIGLCKVTADELMGTNGYIESNSRERTIDRAMAMLQKELVGKTVPASEIVELAETNNIGERTLRDAKSNSNVKSVKKGNQWFWTIPE